MKFIYLHLSRLFVCVFVCLFVCMFVCLFVYLVCKTPNTVVCLLSPHRALYGHTCGQFPWLSIEDFPQEESACIVGEVEQK